MLALSIVGSATLLLSCGKKTKSISYDNETLMTESSEHRTITMMENGKRSYTFTSPLMEGYRLATNPYQEFRRGIEMTTYSDSLSLPEVTITANYAIYYERQKLWEAKGNVVVIRRDRKDGDTTVTGLTEVYTQQLFWNATTKKIYSNVDTKVLQADGWHFGVGFDADDDLKNIHFRKYSSELEFDMSQPADNPDKDNKEKDKKQNERNKSKDNAEKGGNRSSRDSGVKRDVASKQQPRTEAPIRPAEQMPVGNMQLESGAMQMKPTSSMREGAPNRGLPQGESLRIGDDSAPKKMELSSSAKSGVADMVEK